MYPVPGKPGEFYGLEDRGPNVTAADGNDVEPIPTFDPAIGKFRFVDGKAELLKEIRSRTPRATRTRAWSGPRTRPAR